MIRRYLEIKNSLENGMTAPSSAYNGGGAQPDRASTRRSSGALIALARLLARRAARDFISRARFGR